MPENGDVSVRILRGHVRARWLRDRTVGRMNGGEEIEGGDGGRDRERKRNLRGDDASESASRERRIPIVSRPTSRRREINRAVCIHRRIFQRLSLSQDDVDGGGRVPASSRARVPPGNDAVRPIR